MLRKDRDTLEKMLPGDFVAVYITGPFRPKKSGEMTYDAFLETNYNFKQKSQRVLVTVE
ncbi:hypothetical protein AB3329_09835 [Streptococcus sp. H31]|uniref:hypothetical protein n=1 Tax=Streptococcus huangxiaojuni TaxID=3237239 RepID=UPI0034A4DBEF